MIEMHSTATKKKEKKPVKIVPSGARSVPGKLIERKKLQVKY